MTKDGFDENAKMIEVSYGRTINMGDFNSVRLDVKISDTTLEGEPIEAALIRVWEMARKSVWDQYQDLKNGGTNYGEEN